jgi:hypothetical protein
MPMDSISMFSNTLYVSNVDAGSSLRWWSASTITLCHHFDSTSDHKPQNLTKVCGYNWLRLLPHAHGQQINVFKHFVYV